MFFSHSIGLFKILTLWNKSNWQQHVCYLNIPSWFLIIVPLASHSNLHRKMDLCVCPSSSPRILKIISIAIVGTSDGKGKLLHMTMSIERCWNQKIDKKRNNLQARSPCRQGWKTLEESIKNHELAPSFNKWRHLRLFKISKIWGSRQTKHRALQLCQLWL